ncbi:MAG: serine/threonine-protein kinase [Anaerolineae bacterium]|nr:serine/threonine-protein kinase [Anaerolineae bacterium]
MSNLIGQVINGYEILEELARGGMATVYRAHQISMNRDVALKVLPREFLHEPSFLERFKREASIVARLEHRAIVPVHDYGEVDGIPYIIMRLMEGGSVDGLITKGPVELEKVQQIVRQIAGALDYAHSHDVLHRDLKPSNILLDKMGDAYITDFGIARLLSSNEKLTATGVVGTPAYMSPEQAQGLPLDGRSDIYSLGVVIYEMLTGRRPFEAETPYSIAVMHVTQEPPFPRKFKPDIAPGVEAVVMKALAKDRDQRYRTATELAGQLDDADLFALEATVPSSNSHSPVLSPAPSSAQPTPRRPMSQVNYPSSLSIPMSQPRRSPTLMYVGLPTIIAIILAFILLGGYLFLYDTEPAKAPDFAATGEFRLTATANAVSLAPLREGRILFVSDRNEQPDLYVLDLTTGNETRLTRTNGAEGSPAISPDGDRIVYLFDPDGNLSDDNIEQIEVYISRSDGSDAQPVTSNLSEEVSPIWTPDGNHILFVRTVNGVARYRIIQYDLTTEDEMVLYEDNGYAANLSISPDGQQLVYAVQRTTNPNSREIFRLDIASESATQVTRNDSPEWSPHWNDTGERILYLKQGVAGAAIAEMLADGSILAQIYDGAGEDDTVVYSPDAKYVLFSAEDEDGIRNLFLLPRNRLIAEQITHLGGYNAIWLP